MNERATEVFEAERDRLVSLAYRMLGDRSAAEDVVQNAWLRWQASDHNAIHSPAAWLTSVATRIAIDTLKSARHTRELYVGVWLPEPVVTEEATPTPEDILGQSQSVELALLWAMERLTPQERAAFILREAFDTDYSDIAEILEKSESACRKLIERARRRVHEDAPRYKAPALEVRDLLTRFMLAVQAKDKAALLSLLAPGAVALTDGGGKVRAANRPLIGPEEIAHVFMALAAKKGTMSNIEWVTANGQPALAAISGLESDLIMTIMPDETGQIAWIYIMRNPDKLARIFETGL